MSACTVSVECCVTGAACSAMQARWEALMSSTSTVLGGRALIMHKSHAQDWQSSCPTSVASEAPKGGVCSRLCAGSALCVYIDVQPVHTHQVTAPRCLPRCLVLSAAESIIASSFISGSDDIAVTNRALIAGPKACCRGVPCLLQE